MALPDEPRPEATPDPNGLYGYTVYIDGKPVYSFRGAKLIEFADDAITDPAELAKLDRRDTGTS